MRRGLTLLIVGAALLVLTACDPSQQVIEKGQKIDLGRIEGVVTGKGVRFFEGDNDATKERKGQQYYWIGIRRRDTNQDEEFVDVPDVAYRSVQPGVNLPDLLLTAKRLTEIRGKIVDVKACPEVNQYFVVIDHGYGFVSYSAPIEVFYRYIHVGLELPIDIAPTQ